MALSDSRPTRRLCDVGAASPSRDGSPPMPRITLPACRAPYPGGSRRGPVSIASPLTRPSPFPRRVGIRIFTFEMLWGGRWRDVTIVAGSNADGASHGTAAQRLEPVPHPLGPRQHDHCRHRDEPSKLARRRHCSRYRAPSAEEARTKRGGIAPFVDALACRGNPERLPDHAYRRRVRGGPRRVLAGALAPGPRYRSLRHSPNQRGCLTRASPGENRSPRYGIAQTCLHRLAARRTRSLPHGGHSNAGGGGCQAPEP